MRTHVKATLALGLLAISSGGAGAADDRAFQVGARVVPREPAPLALAALPLPPGSRPMTSDAFGGSYYFPGEVEAAAGFYRLQMPSRGYRLVYVGGDGELAWENADSRVQVALGKALGSVSATRIVVTVSARRSR